MSLPNEGKKVVQAKAAAESLRNIASAFPCRDGKCSEVCPFGLSSPEGDKCTTDLMWAILDQIKKFPICSECGCIPGGRKE